MSIKTDSELIRDETGINRNTATRVGGVLVDMATGLELLQDNQYSGVIVYETLLELPVTGVINTSYKVTNDDVLSSNNGYYHWSGSAYVKDANLANGLVESGNTDAVSGGAVFTAIDGFAPTGIIESGNSDAVSGDTVWNYQDIIEAKANENIKNGTDIKSIANWSDGIMQIDGTITLLGGGYSYFTDEFFESIPNVTVIKFSGISSFSALPLINGYSKDKTVVTNILLGISTLSTETLTYYAEVPSDVYFLRFATREPFANEFICEITSKSDFIKNVLQDYPRQINRKDYFTDGLLKEHFNDNSTVSIGDYLGSGFVPVSVGDKIRYKGYSISAISAIGGFDSNKNFVKKILNKSEKNTEYVIDLDEFTESNIAYIVASHYLVDTTTPFLIVESSETIDNATDELKGEKANSKVFGYEKKAPVIPLTANSTVTKIDGFDILESIALPAYFQFDVSHFPSNDFLKPFIQVEIELTDLGGNASAQMEIWRTILDSETHVFTSIGEKYTFTMFDGVSTATGRLLECNVIGVKFKVTKSVSLWFENAFFDSYSLNGFYALSQSTDFFTKFFNFSDFTTKSNSSSYLDSVILKSKKYASFGDSITNDVNRPDNYAISTADYFKMELTNLGQSGSIPVNNLNDAQLALIPTDVQLVTITGGTNGGYVDEADVTSRDRANSVGVLNYAIDYIELNHPQAIIVLITPPQRNTPPIKVTGWGELYRNIGVYRNLIVGEFETNINWSIQTMPTLTLDNVHPTEYGVKRLAGVVIGAINKVIF